MRLEVAKDLIPRRGAKRCVSKGGSRASFVAFACRGGRAASPPGCEAGFPSWTDGNTSQWEGNPSQPEGNPKPAEGNPSPAEGNPSLISFTNPAFSMG